MTAHQKAAEDMQKIVAGQQVTCKDLMNIRACIVYGTTCLEGLDPKRFSPSKVNDMIDQALQASTVIVELPPLSEPAAA